MKFELIPYFPNPTQPEINSLEKFGSRYGLTMVVRDHGPRKGFRNFQFSASFKDCEIKDGCMLSSEYGRGDSPDSTIDDYRKIISGKLLVVGAYTDNRREIQVPHLICINNES